MLGVIDRITLLTTTELARFGFGSASSVVIVFRRVEKSDFGTQSIVIFRMFELIYKIASKCNKIFIDLNQFPFAF